MLFTAAMVLLAIAYFAAGFRPKLPAEPIDLRTLAALPVSEHGRVKPIDTVARTTLLLISDKQTFEDAAGERQPALKFLMDTMSNRPEAMEHRVFRIENDDVLATVELLPRKGFRYAWNELRPALPDITAAARNASNLPASQRRLFDRKVLELQQQVSQFQLIATGQHPLVAPPPPGAEAWQSPRQIVMLAHAGGGGGLSPIKRHWLDLLNAYRMGDAAAANQNIARLRTEVRAETPTTTFRTGLESLYNQLSPFTRTAALYVLAGLLACFGWLGWPKGFLRAAVAVMIVACVIHTSSLGLRMYLHGRPPVTNLYSSAIFVGWVTVLACFIFEAIFRNGIATVAGAAVGFITLVIAHNLAMSTGETLETLQPVLDTNFWLATHVTIVTAGYSATFLAGVFGIIFVLRGVFTKTLGPTDMKSLGRMIYGTICFALLLSFTGTVLGGIWADQSWGRFWGWDPKENGALMIVIWNAIILHARWGGMARARGMAVMAIFGNIITAWSWFGVNMLGVGLHSYGHMDAAVTWLSIFVASQLIFIAIGMLPDHAWRSPPDPKATRQSAEPAPTP